MKRRLDHLSIVLVGIAIASCDLALVDLAPETSPPHFTVSVTRRPTSSGPDEIRILAELRPGISTEGDHRTVPDPTLRIDARDYSPLPDGSPSSIAWQIEADQSDFPFNSIGILPPTISGFPPSAEAELEIPIRFLMPVGDTVAVATGEDLVFQLFPPTQAGDSLEWAVGLSSTGEAGSRVTVSATGEGEWPAEIRILADLLPPGGFPFQAEIHLQTRNLRRNLAAGYEATMTSRSMTTLIIARSGTASSINP